MKSPLQRHIEKMESEQSPKPKVIGEYIDPKYGIPVKVYEGVRDVPFKSMPVGDIE